MEDYDLYPLISLLGTGVVTWLTYNFVVYLKDTSQLRSVIKRKQDEREESFKRMEANPRYQLNEDHEKILALSDDDLISGLQSRKLKATEVLNAFVAKALKITREINSITEFIPEAEEWAEQMDKMEEVGGPLHGVPISVKDNCNIKGMDSTLGLGKFLYLPADKTSVIVQSLIDLGAIPFCKTNVPQTLLSFGCQNPVFGLTKNNLNPRLSPGGSSGGESSLISAGGSIIGIGSDIGGSVRIPAHFTGIAGIKATMHRISSVGFRGSLPNVVGLAGVPGLMTKNAKTLARIFKHLVEDGRQHKYDPLALPIPWNETMFSSTKQMRIGYFTELPYFPLIGDTESVVLKAKQALESAGHILVPFTMPNDFEMMDIIFDFAFGDKGAYLLKNWKNEPIPPSVIFNYIICKSPLWFRSVLATVMEFPYTPVIHSTRASAIIRGGADTTGELWSRVGDRKLMIAKLIESWKRADVDLVLCPTYAFPAIPHNLPGRLQPSVIYTMIWNLFDFPAGVVKFGRESGERVDAYNDQGDMVLKLAKQGCREAVGMPISVQLVSLPYEEEKVLRGMVELESLYTE